MQRRTRLRSKLGSLLASACVMLFLAQFTFATGAHAADGTWGAGSYPYAAGLVCTTAAAGGTTASTTSPLAAWDLGSGGAGTGTGSTSTLGYLTDAPTSDGLTDSAAPPLASVGAQSSAPMSVGEDGFGSAAEIAAYARLLSTPEPDDATAAKIASAVLAKTSTPGTALPSCAADPSTMLTAAAALAGPYSLTLTPPAASIDPGATGIVVASVLAASGRPVPDMPVTVSTPGGAAATPTPTDANGRAQIAVSVPAGTNTAALTVSASISAPTGLAKVSVTGVPTSTNPSGQVVAALTPDTPVTVNAQTTVPVTLTANPSITATPDHTGLAIGTPIVPQAVITGLHGHSASVTFTIYGPLQPAEKQTCSDVSFDAKSTVAASTAAVTVTGDQTFKAGAWAPDKTGCYLVHAALSTTDAQPATTADSGYDNPASVTAAVQPVATVASVTSAGDAQAATASTAAAPQSNAGDKVVSAGAQHGVLTLSGSQNSAGTINATLVGPVDPNDSGSCAQADFTNASRVATATTTTSGDGPYVLASSEVTRAGCYQWQGSVTLAVGTGTTGTVTVPITGASDPLLVLVPTIQLALGDSFTARPAPADTVVTVNGLEQQPAHVVLHMHYSPVGPQGCRSIDWTHTAVATAGPETALPPGSDLISASVSTGALSSLGCWYPVAVLTVDANHDITAQTPLDDGDSAAILAGIDPDATRPVLGGGVGTGSSWTRVVIAGGGFGALELVAIVLTVVLAHRSSRARARESRTSFAELIGDGRPDM